MGQFSERMTAQFLVARTARDEVADACRIPAREGLQHRRVRGQPVLLRPRNRSVSGFRHLPRLSRYGPRRPAQLDPGLVSRARHFPRRRRAALDSGARCRARPLPGLPPERRFSRQSRVSRLACRQRPGRLLRVPQLLRCPRSLSDASRRRPPFRDCCEDARRFYRPAGLAKDRPRITRFQVRSACAGCVRRLHRVAGPCAG